jgi:hexosaminidase
LDVLEINYANHLYDLEGEIITEDHSTYLELSALTEGKVIRFTTDGSDPTQISEVYSSKIPLTESKIIKAAVFDGTNRLGSVYSLDFKAHKAVGQKISIDKTPHRAYSGSGAKGLVNGVLGSDLGFGDNEWLGFWGDDIWIEIEFDKPTPISKITTRFHNGNGQWIYAPKMVGITYYFNDQAPTTVQQIRSDDLIVDFSIDNSSNEEIMNVDKLLIFVKNYGTIPEGKQGAGNPAWTFIDEIVIE